MRFFAQYQVPQGTPEELHGFALVWVCAAS
jgi:hypothetical protein